MRALLIFSSLACGFSPLLASVSVMGEEALTLLRAGNARFASGNAALPRQSLSHVRAVAEEGQQPIATVLTCSDSHVPPELIFDQGFGDLFVIRVAGNVVDVDQAASIEYGVEQLGTPALIVLGNAACGVMGMAVRGEEAPGNLPLLIDNLAQPIEETRKRFPELDDAALVPFAVQSHVQQSINDLLEISPLTARRVKEGDLEIFGAVYDPGKGVVHWMPPTPELAIMARQGEQARARRPAPAPVRPAPPAQLEAANPVVRQGPTSPEIIPLKPVLEVDTVDPAAPASPIAEPSSPENPATEIAMPSATNPSGHAAADHGIGL